MLFFRGGILPPLLYTYLKILYKKKVENLDIFAMVHLGVY